MVQSPHPRRELVAVITAGWVIGVCVGTPAVFIFFGIVRASPDLALGYLVLLPIVLPVAILLSVFVFIPGLALAISFPNRIIRHRGWVFAAVPVAVVAWIIVNGGNGFIGFDQRLETTCAVVDACIANIWSYYFTGHLTDQV